MTDDSPMYRQIKKALLEAIGRHEYEPGQPFITQREVCERFDVSTTTAVRALNELVAEGVLVRQRGRGTFVAERQAAPVPSERERTIACIVHGLEGPHVTQIVQGVESVCAELGFRMFLSQSGASVEREAQALSRAVFAGASGVVLYPADAGTDPATLAELRRHRVPLVMVDRYQPDVPTDAVLADNFAVGYTLTRHLLERGHRRIAMLWAETQSTAVQDRLAGHLHALREHGVPVLPELTTLRSYIKMPEPNRRALLSGLLHGGQPPTVLLCAHGYVLAAAAADLLAAGVQVPDDVDLAGLDDAGPFDLLPLAAVAAVLPSEEMGRRAMRLLAERIAGDDPYRDPQHIMLPVGLRTRDSAAAHLRAVSTQTG